MATTGNAIACAGRIGIGVGFSVARCFAAADSLGQIDRHAYAEPTKSTVAEYLRTWVDGRADLRPATQNGYRGLIETHVIPTLGCVALGMVHRLTGGAWGVVIRQPISAASRALPVMALLFIPVLVGMRHLYPWTLPAASDAVATYAPRSASATRAAR